MNSTITINNKLKLIIPVNLITTVDYYFHDDEFLKPNIKTDSPVKKSKLWIKKYLKINNLNSGL